MLENHGLFSTFLLIQDKGIVGKALAFQVRLCPEEEFLNKIGCSTCLWEQCEDKSQKMWKLPSSLRKYCLPCFLNLAVSAVILAQRSLLWVRVLSHMWSHAYQHLGPQCPGASTDPDNNSLLPSLIQENLIYSGLWPYTALEMEAQSPLIENCCSLVDMKEAVLWTCIMKHIHRYIEAKSLEDSHLNSKT